jgi:hypothetical protein
MKYTITIPHEKAEMEAWGITAQLGSPKFKVYFRPRQPLAKIEFESCAMPNAVELAAKAVNPAAKVLAT